MGHTMKATFVLSVAAFMLAGCEMKLGDTGASKKVSPPENVKSGDAAFLDEAPVRQDAETRTGGAVETALEWAKKYADVSEQLNQEQQQKQVR